MSVEKYLFLLILEEWGVLEQWSFLCELYYGRSIKGGVIDLLARKVWIHTLYTEERSIMWLAIVKRPALLEAQVYRILV